MILDQIKANEVSFQEVIAHIEANFEFTPTAFKNGDTYNAVGQNSGSVSYTHLDVYKRQI